MQPMHEGEILELVTDNYKAIQNDVFAWTRMTGHKLRDHVEKEDYYIFYIEKSYTVARNSTLALVISGNGLTELLSPLGFSLAAALEGIDVYLYFQGPAVKVLKRDFKAKLKGFGRPFSKAAQNGMAKVGHVSPQDKLHQLRSLGAHIYVCAPSMDRYKVKQDELLFEDIIVAEYMTFAEILYNADIHVYVQ
jgi:predicted peroxiredoxin